MRVDNGRVSESAWGEVDKGELGRRLAEAYAAGEADRALIREAYAYVPDEAFDEDAEGRPRFLHSKGWGPHHVLDGETLIVHQGGVQAAAAALAGARAEPSLSPEALASARRHIRRHYRDLEMEMPESLTERLALAELTRGSYEYAAEELARAWREQTFGMDYVLVETFADAVIVRELEAPADEFWRVPYERDADGRIVFAPRAEWERVLAGYAPQEVQEAARRTGRRRLTEELEAPKAELLEAAQAPNGQARPRRIRINGLMRAGVVNGNGRRYPAEVLEAAVREWRTHLHESAGQGRLKILTGEADHPDDKGHRRPQFLETVVKWTDVKFDGVNVNVEGEIIPTSKGKDLLTLMEAGVRPGGSVRGYYEAKPVREDGRVVEQVTWCQITGADLVGDPSFENVADLLESKRRAGAMGDTGDETMDAEKLMELIKAHPELFKGVVAESVREMTEAQIKALEAQVRAALQIDEKADLTQALAEAAEAKRKLEAEAKRQRIEAAIGEAVKGLSYGKELNEAFAAELRESVTEPEQVASKAAALRKRYDQIVSAARLAGMGYRGVQVLGPVLERETGWPEFARAAWEFSESMVKRGIAKRRNFNEPKTINEQMAARVLERFDQVFRLPLMREAQLAETETSSDLNLPFSVSRAILAEVWPELVATSIFDVDVTEQTPVRVYYEDYQDVGGKHTTITDESVTAAHNTWVSLAHKMLEPGTVVVTGSGGSPTYTEGTDYVMDYLDGAIYVLSTGGISNGATILVDYHYDAVREGENAAIQRGKMVLSYATLDCKANRLATQITNEAVVFSRSQMGWDATARTLAGLTNELRKEIDRALMYNALSRALIVASNSGGTWTAASDPLINLVSYIGAAKVKVANRYFTPDWVLLSLGNSDVLANWDGFTAAGSRNDATLNANGYVGRLKGLPVFASTEFSSAYALVGNRQIVHYRIYQPMQLKGPYPSYSSDKLVAADQWYAEQYDGAVSPVPGKAAYVKIG